MPWLINRNGLHFLFFPIFSSISEAQLGPVPLPICSTDDKCCWIGERKEKDCRYTCGFCRLGSPSSCCSIIRSVIDTTAADDVDLVSLRTAASVGWLVKYLYTGNPCVFFSLYLHFKSSFHNLSSLSPPIAMRKVGGSISWRSVTAIWNLLSETVDIRQLAAQEWKWNEWWRIREKERETCDKLKVSDRITGRKNPDVASTCFFGWKTTLAQGSWKKDLRATPSCCCCWGLFLNKPNIWVKYTRVAIYDHSTRILC